MMTRHGQQKSRSARPFALLQRKLLFLGFLLGSIFAGAPLAWGTLVKVTTLLDKEITSVNHPVGLRIHIEGTQERPSVEVPESSELQMVSRGTSTSVQVLNGIQKIRQELYYLVIPQKEGTLEVPSLTVRFTSGPEIHTQKFKLTVTPRETPQNLPSVKPGEGSTNPPSQEVFVSAALSQKRVYTGEPLTYFFRFFQALPVGESAFSPPDFGTLPQEVLQSREYSKTVGGISYKVTEVPFLLSPVKPGETTIPKATLEVVLQDREAMRGFLPSGSNFFSSSLEDLLNFAPSLGTPLRLETAPLSFDVLPLPAWKGSPSFSGLVGSADMKVLVQKDHARTGEPLHMVVLLHGVGNMKDVQAPLLTPPPHCKMYQDAPEESLTPTPQGYKGIKAFHYTLVPLREGSWSFPPVRLTLFDPVKKDYEVLEALVPSCTISGPPVSEAPKTPLITEEETSSGDDTAGAFEDGKDSPGLTWMRDETVSLEERLPPLSPKAVLASLLVCPLGYGLVLLWRHIDLRRKAHPLRMVRESKRALRKAQHAQKAEEKALALEKSLRKAIFAHMEREENILEKGHFQELHVQHVLNEDERIRGQQALHDLHYFLYGDNKGSSHLGAVEKELLPIIRRLWK